MDLKIKQWIIICKRDCYCSETGEKINLGEKMMYRPKNKWSKAQFYHQKSNEFKQYENNVHTGHKTN